MEKDITKEISTKLESVNKNKNDVAKHNGKLSNLLEIKNKLAEVEGTEGLIEQIIDYISDCEDDLKNSAAELLSQAHEIFDLAANGVV